MACHEIKVRGYLAGESAVYDGVTGTQSRMQTIARNMAERREAFLLKQTLERMDHVMKGRDRKQGFKKVNDDVDLFTGCLPHWPVPGMGNNTTVRRRQGRMQLLKRSRENLRRNF